MLSRREEEAIPSGPAMMINDDPSADYAPLRDEERSVLADCRPRALFAVAMVCLALSLGRALVVGFLEKCEPCGEMERSHIVPLILV
jgi:hypothetical protein